jgi:RNA polymerase sigma-70 factor, ECF subfamily
MIDLSLLDELKGGSHKAFEHVFRYYYPRIMAYTAVIVDELTAEDIVQDMFLYIWENHTKIEASTGFSSYLFQSAYTRCMDYYRMKRREDQYAVQSENTYLEECEDLLQQDASVIEDLYHKDFSRRLNELLEKLPQQRREAFIMTYVEGLKAKEVAERMNIPQRTVESHVYLTLKYLKQKMSKDDFYML